MTALRKIALLFFLLSTIHYSLSTSSLYADVKLKIAVVNPSQTENQTTPVRYDLPKGLTPDQVTDIGQMELKYDFDKGNYYLYKIVRLKPSQRIIMEIRLRDIWMIPAKDLDYLKNHTKALAEELKRTAHAKTGENLSKKITDRLNAITVKESDERLSMTEHINLYYENTAILDETKEDIGMLENLVIDVGGIVAERVKVPQTLAVAVKGDEAAGKGVLELTVKVSNPSTTTKQTADVKYLLPQETSPRHVVDRGGLEMGYDFSKQSFYVYKDNVLLKPSETRSYAVKLLDIWQIPDVEIDTLRAHTDNLILLLKGTEYFPQAEPLAQKVAQNLDTIKKVQALKVSADEHIANYRKNSILLEETKELIAKMEKLVTQSGASAGVTVKEAEIEKGGGPKERRPRGYEGIDYIVKSIFRGKAPSAATTW
ncbi:MAG: hypothetical protein PHN63_07170, partial [Candidatus Omnitrophica bacterium]|nr:hypothetical protein [Candidatus Omnitrophota bacterium]